VRRGPRGPQRGRTTSKVRRVWFVNGITWAKNPTFSELPGDRHGVSANASETKPAKLLAVFVVDTNETELTIPFGN
jgi:quercetin dioxygenase-like cupin family protein